MRAKASASSCRAWSSTRRCACCMRRRSDGATSTCAKRWRPRPVCPCRSKTQAAPARSRRPGRRARSLAGTAGDIVFVSVSDGVGVGVMIHGEVLRGRHNIAGEFGHLPLSLDGPRCSCGSNGCWEAYVSNRATLARYFGRPADQGPKPVEHQRFQHRGPDCARAIARCQGLGRARCDGALPRPRPRLGHQRPRSGPRLRRRRNHAGLGSDRIHDARRAVGAHAHPCRGRNRDSAGGRHRISAPARRRGARRRAGLCRAGRGLTRNPSCNFNRSPPTPASCATPRPARGAPKRSRPARPAPRGIFTTDA